MITITFKAPIEMKAHSTKSYFHFIVLIAANLSFQGKAPKEREPYIFASASITRLLITQCYQRSQSAYISWLSQSCPASSGFFLAARSHGLRYQKYTRQLALEAVGELGSRRNSELSHRTLHRRRIRRGLQFPKEQWKRLLTTSQAVKSLENISFPGRGSAFFVSRLAQTSRLHYSVFHRSSEPDNILSSKMVHHTTIQK